MKKYIKYKESGIEWIGEIPEHWEKIKLKYLLQWQKGINAAIFTNEYIGNNSGEFPVYSGQTENEGILGFINSYDYDYQEKEVLLVTTVGAKAMTLRTIRYEFSLSQNCALIYPITEIVNSKYYYYYLSQLFIYEKGLISLIMQPSLRFEDLNRYIVFNPSKPEQTTIANFLDHKTAEIDHLISKKEKLFKLYEEEKTAIINEAVTKGINPNPLAVRASVKMKDSGVEWLGKIPEHWEVKKLKYVANANPSNIDKKSKDGEDKVSLCNYVDVYKNDFINSELDFMKATATESQIDKFILEKGDVVATKDSETPDDIGNPALVIDDFENVVCGYHLTHIKPIEINGDFLFRFIQAQFIKSYFEVSANGVTRYGLGVDKFNSALILCPPIEEQINIVQHIETETNRINSKITKTEKLIKLLKEYKTALISEVVTGKIDVREEISNG